MNERLEIEGDMREDVQAERERIEGYEACPVEPETDETVEAYAEEYAEREDMDGDHETALRDAGFGTDEDYGYFGGEDAHLDGNYEE
jgi:hypothetical protein